MVGLLDRRLQGDNAASTLMATCRVANDIAPHLAEKLEVELARRQPNTTTVLNLFWEAMHRLGELEVTNEHGSTLVVAPPIEELKPTLQSDAPFVVYSPSRYILASWLAACSKKVGVRVFDHEPPWKNTELAELREFNGLVSHAVVFAPQFRQSVVRHIQLAMTLCTMGTTLELVTPGPHHGWWQGWLGLDVSEVNVVAAAQAQKVILEPISDQLSASGQLRRRVFGVTTVFGQEHRVGETPGLPT